MIRDLLVAAAIAGAAVGLAPIAIADPGHYDGDVPGMNYDASLGAPCDNYERFIFGRGPGGQAEACHFITNQFPAAQSGYWVITYPLYGVQQVGAPCQNPRGSSAPVSRRAADALHRTRLAGRAADRRRVPERYRRRVPVGHRPDRLTTRKQETAMGFKPKDAIDAARDIVTNAVERSSDIVENAGHIIKGDIAGGTGDIVHNSIDIATYAVDRAKEVFTGKYADDDE